MSCFTIEKSLRKSPENSHHRPLATFVEGRCPAGERGRAINRSYLDEEEKDSGKNKEKGTRVLGLLCLMILEPDF